MLIMSLEAKLKTPTVRCRELPDDMSKLKLSALNDVTVTSETCPPAERQQQRLSFQQYVNDILSDGSGLVELYDLSLTCRYGGIR
jgi:hypothetical protein